MIMNFILYFPSDRRLFFVMCVIYESLSICIFFFPFWGWSGGAMVLGKLPVPGRPTIWMIVVQGPIAFAVGAGGVVRTFLLSTILPLMFILFRGGGGGGGGRRPDID